MNEDKKRQSEGVGYGERGGGLEKHRWALEVETLQFKKWVFEVEWNMKYLLHVFRIPGS